MSQRFPTFYFEWVEDTSQFNEDFIKNYDEKNETTEFKPLNHRLLLPKVHREISFNKDEWVKPYIEMNATSRQKAKKEFEKDFSNWWITLFWGKLWKMWENRDIKLATTERRRNYLVSEPNYHETIFCRKLTCNRKKKDPKNLE